MRNDVGSRRRTIVRVQAALKGSNSISDSTKPRAVKKSQHIRTDQTLRSDIQTPVRYSYCEIGVKDYHDAAPMVDLEKVRCEAVAHTIMIARE